MMRLTGLITPKPPFDSISITKQKIIYPLLNYIITKIY